MLKALFAPRRKKDLDRRQFARVGVPRGQVIIDGRSFGLVDWNDKGFLIVDYDGALRRNDDFALEVSVPDLDADILFAARARVVRRDPANGHLAAVFTELSPEARRRIAAFCHRQFGAR